MKAAFKPIRFTTAVACFALAALFAGCPMDPDDSDNGAGSIPAQLVGSWGDRDTDTEVLRINADGSGTVGTITGGELRWSVDGNRLTMTLIPDGGVGVTSTAGTWAIVGDRLRLSDWEGSMAAAMNMLTYLDRLGGGDAADSGNGGGGAIPSQLVGSWGDTGTGIETLRINANGTGSIHGNSAAWSVNGNRLTLNMGGASGSAAWAIVDGRLRLSNGQGAHGALLQILPDLDRLGGGDQAGGIPASLVGSWGIEGVEFLRINANGTGTIHDSAAAWSVDGNRLFLTMSQVQAVGAASDGSESGSATWQILGGRLRLTNGQGTLGLLLQAFPDLERLGLGVVIF